MRLARKRIKANAVSDRQPPMPDPSPKAVRRNFWQRRLLDPLIQQLTQGVSPEKIAFTIALGSALGLFPLLGTATPLCALAGILFGLNQPIIQGINALCTPIYFPLLVAFVRLGDLLTRTGTASLRIPYMMSLFSRNPGEFFREFGVTALHAALGWAAVAPFWIPAVYFVTRSLLRTAARTIEQGQKLRAAA